MGVYVACATIVVVNTYILINQYRWDWLFVLIITISILLVYLWTAIYSAFKSVGQFYQTAGQIYGSPSFWATSAVTVFVCLLPRMASKVVQKLFFPRDIDIIREQVKQGKFAYLYQGSTAAPSSTASSTSSEFVKPPANPFEQDDEMRPMYPPSVAPTATTAGKRGSGNGSDGTDGSGYAGAGTFTPRRFSLERNRPSIDRVRPSLDVIARKSYDGRRRPSFDRVRSSMDRARSSFEATSDFTSAAMLSRMESSSSAPKRTSVAFESPQAL